MPLDISVRQWLDDAEMAERESIAAELNNLRIARACGESVLPTAALQWDNQFVSGSPRGALTPVVARETLTMVANRRRWARQKALRGGLAGLARSILAPATASGLCRSPSRLS